MSGISNNSAYALVPELGDLVTFVSDVYTSTTGRIIYRDESLIRIKTTSTQAVDFPLEVDTGLFLETLGVREIVLHEKRKDPHFSKQIGVVPGEYIEFYTVQGQTIEQPRIVANVVATSSRDALEFEDGSVMEFEFVGPPRTYGVLRPRAPPEAELPPENNSESYELLQDELQDVFPEINFDLMPAALVAEIPTEERTSDDTTQREDMFLSLLMDVPVRKQKDPKIMRKQYRISDVLLALKNSVLRRDAQGGIDADDPLRKYRVDTVQEALAHQAGGEPLAALVPVAAVKKVLYTDDAIAGATYDDVEFRNDFQSLRDLSNAVVGYEATPGSFAQFTHRYMNTLPAYTNKARDSVNFIRADQDVFRSQVPPQQVQGFPETPAAYKKSRGGIKSIELTNDSLGTIDHRYVRLIGASRIMDHKTKTSILVAPADTADVLGYVLLSDDIMARRAPIRSRVLLWDIEASETSRTFTKTFYNAYAQAQDTQRVLSLTDMTPLVDELYARLRPALSIMNIRTTQVLDSFGLQDLELTDACMEPIDASLRAGQTAWSLGFKQIQERALRALEKPQTPAVAPTVDVGTSGLFTTDIRNAKGIAATMTSIQRIEAAQFESHDLVLANYFLKEASATLGPYWYALAAGQVERAAELAQVYTNESLRLERNAKTQRELASEISATPEINTCPHVYEYERVRGIRNDDIRMIKFGKFVNKYQAGQKGNYILCNTCNKDLVCKHEILLMNEYNNQGRSEALHKALLLEYAGPVFEGAYICKTCGQKIMDIEYDSHLEFDDEGRPLMGRTTAAADEEPADDLVFLGEVEASTPFKTEQERLMYANQRILFEHLGAVFDIATYERTVRVALRYISDVVKTKGDYEAIQARLRAAKRPEGPVYETYFNNQVVGLMGALAVLEIQTSSVQIPIPTAGCALSRAGFPLDGADPAVAGTGALDYVACALAQIKRDVAPWNKVSWTTETNATKRKQEATRVITTLLLAVCAIQRPVIDGVTPLYTEILTAARNRKIAAASEGNIESAPSRADRFPPSFRPLQRATVVDEQPVGNLSVLEAQADAQTHESRVYITDRARQLHHSIMNTFHTVGASQGVIRQNDPCSESVCCFKRVGAVDLTGMGYGSLYDAENPKRKEIDAITSIVATMHARDPALSNTGTHIYVPWSAPVQAHTLPSADSSVYYRLFLKVCYRGRRHGLEHEFDTYLACRNCGFHMPRDLVYMVPAEISTMDSKKRPIALSALDKQREELVLAAFQSQGVVIDEITYGMLEEKVRERKIIASAAVRTHAPFLTLLEQLGSNMSVALPLQAESDWSLLHAGMTGILEEQVTGLRRKGKLEPFYVAFDQRVRDATAALAKERKYDAVDLMGTVMKSIVGHTGIRMLQKLFVIGGNQVANQFVFGAPRIRKWFPKVARGLGEDLQKIWVHADTRANTTLKMMASDITDDGGAAAIQAVLGRLATWYGPWLRIWQESIRVNPATGFNELEHGYVLRWSAAVVIQALLTQSSPLYAGIDANHEVVNIIRIWILNGLTDTRTTLLQHELTSEQVRAQMNARKEQEKNHFIQRMDELDTELRKLEKFKKEIKMGVWSLGNINLSKYNADAWEALREQRTQMGIVDEGTMGGNVEGEVETAAEAAGFYAFGVEDANMGDGTLHRAAQDEDETGGDERPRLNVAC